MTEKTPLLHYFVWFQIHNKRLQLESLSEKLYLFLKNYVTSDRAVSHNVTFNSSPLLVTKYTKSKSPRLHSQIKWNETRCTQSRRKKHPRIQWSYIGLLKHASKLGHHLPTFGNDSRSETSSCTLWGKGLPELWHVILAQWILLFLLDDEFGLRDIPFASPRNNVSMCTAM